MKMVKKAEVSSQMTKEDSEPKTNTQSRSFETSAKALRRKKVSDYTTLPCLSFVLLFRTGRRSKRLSEKSLKVSLLSSRQRTSLLLSSQTMH